MFASWFFDEILMGCQSNNDWAAKLFEHCTVELTKLRRQRLKLNRILIEEWVEKFIALMFIFFIVTEIFSISRVAKFEFLMCI